MATVAIIHAPEDSLPARALAEKLRGAKLTVFLEKTPGEEQRNTAKDAKVTVALWSPRAVTQEAIIDDAKFARGKSKIVHATMQNAALPSGFGGDKVVNLTGWRGEDDFAGWRELAQLVTDRAGVAPLPPPAPRPASGFFQPGVVQNPDAVTRSHIPPLDRAGQDDKAAKRAARASGAPAATRPLQPPPQQARPQPAPAPRPQAALPPRAEPAYAGAGDEPRKGGGNGMMIALIALVVLGGAGGGGYWFWSQQQNAAAATSWESVAQNDADALRAFLAGEPGEFRDEARAALSALEERSYEAASDADTIEGFEAFLNDFPDSEHAIAARGRIAELRAAQPAELPPEGELPPLPSATPDPDLVPPGGVTPQPAPDTGPAPITPPASEEPAPVEPGTDEPVQ
jgi:hypothetical protein